MQFEGDTVGDHSGSVLVLLLMIHTPTCYFEQLVPIMLMRFRLPVVKYSSYLLTCVRGRVCMGVCAWACVHGRVC